MAVSLLQSGTALGHYRLGARIGRGGMGEVYEAFDIVLQRRVALKILKRELFKDPERIRRFVQEARSASALNHPHILTVHEIGEDEVDGSAVHYMAMELVEGTTLREEIHHQRAPLRRLLEILIQAADALAKAHATGIVHRDLKPENIMVTADGYAKIIDFGLAKLAEPRIVVTSADTDAQGFSLTREGGLLGTVGYMAPEQVEQKISDQRSDIFSFGCILYEAVTRSRAFQGDSDVEVLYKLLHEAPASLDNLSGSVPAELRRLLERCLEKRPEDRYQSMRDVALELRAISQQLSGETPSRLQSTPERHPWRNGLWLAIVLLVLIVGTAGVIVKRHSRTENVPVMRALARWPTDEYNCRISPDGAWVSFLSMRHGTPAIWMRQMKGGEPAMLIDRPVEIGSHVWSPQSDQIAYLSVGVDKPFLQFVPAFGGPPRESVALDQQFRDGVLVRWIGRNIYAESPQGLWRFDTVTRTMSKQANGAAQEGERNSFDVSKDEKKTTYSVHRDDRETIWLANLDGSDAVCLTEAETRHSDYRSCFAGRDANEVVFSSDRSGQIDLWRMSVATRHARQVTFSPSVEWTEDVSTDGQTIAVLEDRSYSNLWIWNGANGESRQLTAEAVQDLWPTGSGTSSLVAFQRTKPTIGVPAILDSNIFVAHVAKGQLGEPRLTINDAGQPRLAPSAQWLTYVKRAKGRNFDLWLKDLQSEHQWRLSDRFRLSPLYLFPMDWVELNLTWAPDSSEVYFVALGQSNRCEIRRANPAKNESMTVVIGKEGVEFHDVHLSFDGRLLAYVARSRGSSAQSEVIVRDLASGHQSTLFSRTHDPRERIFCQGWRRNGDLVVLQGVVNPDRSERLQAVQIDAAGGQTVLPLVARGFGGAARLDPLSDSIILTTIDPELGFHNLMLIALDDGRKRQLTNNRLPGISFAGLEVLPNNQVLFSRQEANSDLWLIDFSH